MTTTATFDCHGQDSDLTKFDGQKVEVLSQVPTDTYDFEDVGPMFRIRFADGTEVAAFGDELEDADGNRLHESVAAA